MGERIEAAAHRRSDDEAMTPARRVLLNASTCAVGGALQVSASFIRYAIEDPHGIDFVFVVSPILAADLEDGGVSLDSRFRVMSPSPARIVAGRRVRRQLLELERRFRPHLVYSITSPAYVRFKSPELARFTDGWVTHAGDQAYGRIPVLARQRKRLKAAYKLHQLRHLKHLHTQTEVARRGLLEKLRLDERAIRVIPNSCSPLFRNDASHARTPVRESAGHDVEVFTLASAYEHKNLQIIPMVAAELSARSDRSYKFHVTISGDSPTVRDFWALAREHDVMDSIVNLGHLKLHECPRWYLSCDIVFLPTLLETFSATYLEAMEVGRPLVTTDLGFAHDTCADAALYYAPTSASAAADAIERLASDPLLAADLVRRGRERLAEFPSAEEIYELQIAYVKEICNAHARTGY